MDKQQHYERLVRRYLDNTATKEELAVFFSLLEKGELDAYLERLSLPASESASLPEEKKAGRRLLVSYRMLGYAAAATVVWILFSVGSFLYHRTPTAPKEAATAALPQAAPGTRKAVLTLADGARVTLGTEQQVLQQGSVQVKAGADGLVYEAAEAKPQSVGYNHVATPLGGEYRLVLPDGSQVWLNAGTTLRYPTAFSGAERRVELSGEAYFEVTKNAAQPFVVQTSNADVKVLGTQFNVMAYADEGQSKTTLAEGAVLVQRGSEQQRLSPGQAATVSPDRSIAVAPADVNLELAWKAGNFDFRKTELKAIMRQIARWYDLEVRYAGAVPSGKYVGRISRNTNLSQVLNVLRLAGLKFSMTGRVLTVEG